MSIKYWHINSYCADRRTTWKPIYLFHSITRGRKLFSDQVLKYLIDPELNSTQFTPIEKFKPRIVLSLECNVWTDYIWGLLVLLEGAFAPLLTSNCDILAALKLCRVLPEFKVHMREKTIWQSSNSVHCCTNIQCRDCHWRLYKNTCV